MKVVIAIPSLSTWLAGFGMDVVKLVFKHRSGEPPINVLNVKGAPHCVARSLLVDDALNAGASHMLWLDSDMRFPDDILERLLSHKKPIVGANYITRHDPHIFVASRNGEIIKTTNANRGLEEVDTVGFGVMLISMAVFKQIPKPWFLFEYDGENYRGEDEYFCRKAREAGLKIYIDHDLSKMVCHTATLDLPFHMGLTDDELGQ